MNSIFLETAVVLGLGSGATVLAAALAVRENRWVRIGGVEAAALGLVHDGADWRLLCRGEDGALRAEMLDEGTAVDVLPRRHSPTSGFDALAAWDQLRAASPAIC